MRTEQLYTLMMYKWVFLNLFFLFANASKVQTKVVADITGFKDNTGVCRACIFNSASSFSGKGQPFQCIVVPINNTTIQAIFENIPSGVYAISVFHDINNNNQMDKNFFGIPKEGYGASKNKLPFATAPSFKDNKFFVAANTTTQLIIKIRNL